MLAPLTQNYKVPLLENKWRLTGGCGATASISTKVVLVRNQSPSQSFQMADFVTEPLRVSALVFPLPALLSLSSSFSFTVWPFYQNHQCGFWTSRLLPHILFGLKTKEESQSKNRRERFETPLMGWCCRRKQLILITNVQSEEEDSFGPSSKPSDPNLCKRERRRWREWYREKEGEYPAMCSPYASHSEWGLWISAVMLQTGPSLPIILPLSPLLHKSKPHRLKESGREKN